MPPTLFRTRAAVLAISFSLCGPVLAANGQEAVQDPLVEKGRTLAEHMCATCHLNPGQGEKTASSSIPGFAAVAKRQGQSIAGIVAWLASVPPMMPNHHLSGDEMTAIAAYILTLAPPADAQPVN